MESVLNNNGSALYLHTFHARPDCSSVNGEKLQSQTQSVDMRDDHDYDDDDEDDDNVLVPL